MHYFAFLVVSSFSKRVCNSICYNPLTTGLGIREKTPCWDISYKLRAGGLSVKARCYAVVVLADNSTFSLAFSTIWPHFAHSPQTNHTGTEVISHLGLTGRASASESWGCGFESLLGQGFFTCLCPLRHMRLERNYLISVLERGQLQCSSALL